MALVEIPYDREKAVAYAHRWAYFRNPEYFNFSGIGGDCTNFASQCIFAGSSVMNYTPVYGWYYISADRRTASWTGVRYLYDFLTSNEGTGPFGYETTINGVVPGDIVQIRFKGESSFGHTPVIVDILGEGRLDDILIAAHSNDCDCRPLSSYENAMQIRYIHIDAVRYQSV